MFFDTDEEFADFVFQPYAVFSENNGQLSYDGAYSEQYLKAVKEGKKFVIMKGSLDSAVNRRKIVSKRVLVPEEFGSSRKDVCVSLSVDNLSNGFVDLQFMSSMWGLTEIVVEGGKADYIGMTNDTEGKYFNLEEYQY